MFSIIKTTILISLAIGVAKAANNGELSKRLDDIDPLFNKEGSPALSDFDSLVSRMNPAGAALYALKAFETKDWMKQHIHPAQIDGHAAAYFDIYGEDGQYKTYPVWVQGDNPWWISGYAFALHLAREGKDPIKKFPEDDNIKAALSHLTGKKTEQWHKKDLTEDKLMDILKKYKDSPIVYGSGEDSVGWYYAVTGLDEAKKMVEFWYRFSGKDAGEKIQVPLQTVFDKLYVIGKLQDGETLAGVASPNEDWKTHISSDDLYKIGSSMWK